MRTDLQRTANGPVRHFEVRICEECEDLEAERKLSVANAQLREALEQIQHQKETIRNYSKSCADMLRDRIVDRNEILRLLRKCGEICDHEAEAECPLGHKCGANSENGDLIDCQKCQKTLCASCGREAWAQCN